MGILCCCNVLTGFDEDAATHEMKSYSLLQKEAIDVMLQEFADSEEQRIQLRKQCLAQKKELEQLRYV
jgi:hypothetical protein